jgi:heme exporter protein CcmD
MSDIAIFGADTAYVLPAYGAAAAILLGLLAASLVGLRRRRAALARLEAELGRDGH